MIKVKDIENFLFQWAPFEYAESWDNVGLLVGNPDDAVERILVALDITDDVIDEAINIHANLIVAHHPIMNCTWHKVQSVRSDDMLGGKICKLVKNDISVICMHTNLDAADGGVNDVLAKKLELQNIIMLSDDRIGRIGELKCEKSLVEFTESVLKLLSSNGLRYVNSGKKVSKVAVGGGACGEFIANAIEQNCDTFVTSDLKYHDFLDYGKVINLIDAGHFPTEQLICGEIVERLSTSFSNIPISLTTVHNKEIIQYCVKGEV